MAENVAREKETLCKEKISNGWWRRFIEQQSKLSLHRDSEAYVRMDAISQESISRYFNLLESILEEHRLEYVCVCLCMSKATIQIVSNCTLFSVGTLL